MSTLPPCTGRPTHKRSWWDTAHHDTRVVGYLRAFKRVVYLSLLSRLPLHLAAELSAPWFPDSSAFDGALY